MNLRREAVRPEDYWEFQPGERVMTIDGYPGKVDLVEDGPISGAENYVVTLDSGMGGGNYSASMLTKMPTSRSAAGIHLATDDYPELGTVLDDRPDPGKMTFVAAKVVPNTTRAEADAEDHDEEDQEEIDPSLPTGSDDQPHSCSYCGGTEFKDFADNGRVRQATCATCNGTMSAHPGAQWTPELIGDPSNHPKATVDPRSGASPGAGAPGQAGINDFIDFNSRGSTTAALAGHDWCTWRREARCTFPGDSTAVSLAIPQDRGPCPWDTAWQQQVCPISEPGPMALMQAKGSISLPLRVVSSGTTAALEARMAAKEEEPVYLRFGDWRKDERSENNVTGHREEGVSVYDLDHHGDPKDPDPDYSRGHEHDEYCDSDCSMHLDNDDYGNDTHEEMNGRVNRAERGRYRGNDLPSERAHLVKGEMVGFGHDGEPLLQKVKRVGDWIDHKHHFFPGAEPHQLARRPGDDGYEHPKGLPAKPKEAVLGNAFARLASQMREKLGSGSANAVPARKVASGDSWVGHRPPGPGQGNPLHDLNDVHGHQNGSAFGINSDVYSHPQHWTGFHDHELDHAVKSAEGHPDAPVTVYRAQPREHQSIRNGDWVTPSAAYAHLHGSEGFDGPVHVVKATVPAQHVWTNADDIAEAGYHGPHIEHAEHHADVED